MPRVEFQFDQTAYPNYVVPFIHANIIRVCNFDFHVMINKIHEVSLNLDKYKSLIQILYLLF